MITIPIKITCDHRTTPCAVHVDAQLQLTGLRGFYADGASMNNAVDVDDLKLPTGWIALHYRWQDNGQIELRTYCPDHADQHRGEGHEL